VLNLHHRPETITAAIGDGGAFGVQVRYSWERAILGSAGGPARALPLLDADRFFLVNGDTLTDLDLAALAARHLAAGAEVTMALVANPDPLRYGGVLVDGEGRVTGFTPPGPANRGWHFIGVQVVESTVFAPLDPDMPSETVTGMYRDAIAGNPGAVRAYVTEASFSDIGTAADYLETCLALARHEGLGDTLLGARSAVGAGARVSRSVLWDDVTVGEGAVLDECVVADGVAIPGRTHFARRVLTPRTVHEPGPGEALVEDVLVSPLDARRRRPTHGKDRST
jgi:NDP-sugar pyrophosphorylase family protein